MTLQQINYALTTAKTGSMNRAAEALFVSQPSLSAAIHELEREVGLRIFDRTGKGAVPTPEGEDFLRYARQVYQQYELLLEKYGAGGAAKRKFGVSAQHYSFAVKAFVETVKRYDTLNYEFAMRETKTAEVISDVSGMKSEVGILYKSGYNGQIITKMLRDGDLLFTPLISCRAYVYLSKKHPLAGESSISLEQLRDYPRMSFEQGDGSTSYLAEEILGDRDYPRVIKSNDRATQLNLMVGLNGYTLCSGIICEELNGSLYTAVPFEDGRDDPDGVMEIGYITRKNSVLSDIAETYISEAKKYLGKNRA